MKLCPRAWFRGTGCSYYFFSAWLQRFSKIMQTVTIFPLFCFSIPSPGGFLTLYTPFLVDLGPPFVDYAGRYSSAYPICCLPKPSVSCSNQGSTAQGSFPH